MMAPPTIIDYIVVHELCHFRHLDHTEAFWNEVDKVMPDYAERKEWLRKNGARWTYEPPLNHVRERYYAARTWLQVAFVDRM